MLLMTMVYCVNCLSVWNDRRAAKLTTCAKTVHYFGNLIAEILQMMKWTQVRMDPTAWNCCMKDDYVLEVVLYVREDVSMFFEFVRWEVLTDKATCPIKQGEQQIFQSSLETLDNILVCLVST